MVDSGGVGGEPAGDATDGLVDVGQRARIRETDMALALRAEAGPGDDGDAQLVEPAILELQGRKPGAADVGEGVEGALRPPAAQARELVQGADDGVAATGEGGDHLI